MTEYLLLYESHIALLYYYWRIIGQGDGDGDGDSDLHSHDWQVNTIDGPTKLVRQDAILGGLLIGQCGALPIDFVLRSMYSGNVSSTNVSFHFSIA